MTIRSILFILHFIPIITPAARAAEAREDIPGFRWRGVLEGFYGRPWTWEERRRLIPWMAAHRMNLFVIAPKDDDLLRRDWRRPLPQDYIEGLRSLQKTARANGVELAWTLSPGLDLRPGSAADLDAAAAKYETVMALGARKLVLAFDDTDPAPGQIEFANRVLARIISRRPDVEMTFIPAEYWFDGKPSRYLRHAAQALDARFRVGWTGPQVLSRRITAEDARVFREFIRHPLVLGDNYPVQDRLTDAGRLFLGPLRSRDPAISRHADAWVANASPLMEASKLPLATVAAFARDPARYDPDASWEAEIRSQGGRGTDGLRLLARECSASWISEPSAGGIEDALRMYDERRDPAKLKILLRRAQDLPTSLSAIPSAPLRRELDPWARKLAAQARAALAAVELQERPPPRGAAFEGAKTRLERFRDESEAMPAVVADQSLDRFLNRAQSASEGSPPMTTLPLRALVAAYAQAPDERNRQDILQELGRFERAPAILWRQPGDELNLFRELNPWIQALAMAAARTRTTITDPARSAQWIRWNSPFSRIAQRWAARAQFLPLLASQKLMESFFDDLEVQWGRPRRRELPRLMGLWLPARRFVKPASFPVRLAHALRGYRKTGDDAELARLFRELRDLPRSAPRAIRVQLPEENEPWMAKVAAYGEAGLEGLELKRRFPNRLPPRERSAWDRRIEGLRSGNGLELALEVKLRLEALADWLSVPAERRPERPDIALPANPADIP